MGAWPLSTLHMLLVNTPSPALLDCPLLRLPSGARATARCLISRKLHLAFPMKEGSCGQCLPRSCQEECAQNNYVREGEGRGLEMP